MGFCNGKGHIQAKMACFGLLLISIFFANGLEDIPLQQQADAQLEMPVAGESSFPRLIWMYWSDSSEMPLIHRLCLERMRKAASESGWEVRLVSDGNLHEHVSNYSYFVEVVGQRVSSLVAHKADLIRLLVIERNGGVWMDLSNILTEDLGWLENVQSMDLAVNRFVEDPDVLLFYNSMYQSALIYWAGDKPFSDALGFENWFIAARPRAKLIRDWRMKFVQYYTSTFDNIVRDISADRVFIAPLAQNSYLMQHMALYSVLHSKQRALDSEAPLRSVFSPNGQTQRKTAYQHYKLWGKDCMSGPLHIVTSPISTDPLFQIRLMVEKDYSEVEKIYGNQHFFIKLTHEYWGPVQRVLLNKFNSEGKKEVQKETVFSQQSTQQQLSAHCSNLLNHGMSHIDSLVVVEGSLIDKFLISQSRLRQSFEVIPRSQYQRLCSLCQRASDSNPLEQQNSFESVSIQITAENFITFIRGHQFLIALLMALLLVGPSSFLRQSLQIPHQLFFSKVSLNESLVETERSLYFPVISEILGKLNEAASITHLRVPALVLIDLYFLGLFRDAYNYHQLENDRLLFPYQEVVRRAIPYLLSREVTRRLIYPARSHMLRYEAFYLLFRRFTETVTLYFALKFLLLMFERSYADMYTEALLFVLVGPMVVRGLQQLEGFVPKGKFSVVMRLVKIWFQAISGRHCCYFLVILFVFKQWPRLWFFTLAGSYMTELILDLSWLYLGFMVGAFVFIFRGARTPEQSFQSERFQNNSQNTVNPNHRELSFEGKTESKSQSMRQTTKWRQMLKTLLFVLILCGSLMVEKVICYQIYNIGVYRFRIQEFKLLLVQIAIVESGCRLFSAKSHFLNLASSAVLLHHFVTILYVYAVGVDGAQSLFDPENRFDFWQEVLLTALQILTHTYTLMRLFFYLKDNQGKSALRQKGKISILSLIAPFYGLRQQ